MKNNNKPKPPKHFFVLKFLGFSLLIIGIVLIILGTTVLGGEHSPNPAVFAPGMVLAGVSVPLLMFGFAANISNAAIKTQKYIQERSKDDLKDIADTGADIVGDALTKTVGSVKEGLNDTIFCKHCGAKIDSDSKFCNQCGKEQ